MTEKRLFRLFASASKLENTKKGKGFQITPSSFVLSYLRAFVIGLWCFAAYSLLPTAYLISALDFTSGLDIA
jgi:hypothetical protein